MAKRKGMVGKIFGDGSAHAAKRIKKLTGHDPKEFGAIPMHIKNQDLPMHDSRYSPTLALVYKSDAAPGRHTVMGAGLEEALRYFYFEWPDYDPYDYASLYRIQKHIFMTDSLHLLNCAGLCWYESFCHPPITEEFLELATGWEGVDNNRIGERVANLRQAFNFREGLEPMNWEVPKRALNGMNPGYSESEEVNVDLDTMLGLYLQAREWDPITAKPSYEKLIELDLEDVAEDLYRES